MDTIEHHEKWFHAVIDGDLETVDSMIAQHIDVDIRTNRGRTAMMLAAMHGHTSILDALLRAGADIDERLPESAPGEAMSFMGPDLAKMETIISTAAAEVRDGDDEGKAFVERFHELIGALGDSDGETDSDAVPFEEPKADDQGFADHELATALHHAVAYGHVEIVRRLIEESAEIDAFAWDITPPLVVAARRGDILMLDLLLGADAKADDGFDLTPLDVAAEEGHAVVVNKLLEAGADVNHAGEDGITPLMRAASSGRLDVVRILVEAGADPCAWDEGETPLLNAVNGGFEDIAAYLDPFVTDDIRDFVRRNAAD